MNMSEVWLLVILLSSCKSTIPFEAKEYYLGPSVTKYYNGSVILEFHSDETYRYMVKMEGGYVYEFSKGVWRQEGNNLLLLNRVPNPKELPVSFRRSPSDEMPPKLVINVLPKEDPQFAHMPGVHDLLNVDLVIDNVTYPLKYEATVIDLQKSFTNIYFKAYPKPNVENQSEILNDTLRSKIVSLDGMGNNILTVDVDCNPVYFAQVKQPDDTLRMINEYKIKWDRIYFTRAR